MDLLTAMRSENAKSKRYYRARIIFNILSLVLSWLAVYYSSNLCVSLFLLLLPCCSFFSTELSLRRQGVAGRMRRLVMLMDSLANYKPSKLELKQLQFDIGKLDNSEPEFTRPYYDSALPHGVNRLADNIAESAYFTSNLSKIVCQAYAALTVLFLLFTAFFIYTLLQIGIGATTAKNISQCVALLVVFLATADFSYLTFRYFDLHKTCFPLVEKCEALKNQSNPCVVEVLNTYTEYNCALALCPPLPSWAYALKRDELNKSWRQR